MDSINLPGAAESADLEILIERFFGSDYPLIISIDGAAHLQKAVLNLWNWQWGELRKVYTFCTGAISPRRLEGVDFQLQVIPQRQRSRFSTVGNVVQDLFTTPGSAELPIPSVVLSDVGREFVLRWGLTTPPLRKSVRTLAHLWRRLLELADGRPESIKQVLILVSTAFNASEATELKVALIRDLIPQFGQSSSANCKSETVDALIPLPPGFEIVGSLIRDLSSEGWRQERESRHGPLHANLQRYITLHTLEADECLRGIAAILEEDDVLFLLKACPNALLRLVGYGPHVLAFKGLWTADDKFLEHLTEILDEDIFSVEAISSDYADPDAPPIKEVLLAALGAHNVAAAGYFVQKAPAAFVPVVLDWTEQNSLADPNQVQAILEGQGEAALQWLVSRHQATNVAAAIVLRVLRYDTSKLRSTDINLWIPLAGAEELWDRDSLLRTKVGLLELGFARREPMSAVLVRETFGTIHDSLMEDNLPWGYWEGLTSQLGEIAWGHRWDKVERLRQGLIDHFIDAKWPLEEFAKTVAHGTIWDRMVQSRILRYRQEVFLKHFVRSVQQGSVSIDDHLRGRILMALEPDSP